jgi:ABC-type lipoprotein export system ATPase subunit
VTHDASLRQKADRIIEMKDGRIVNIEYKINQKDDLN